MRRKHRLNYIKGLSQDFASNSAKEGCAIINRSSKYDQLLYVILILLSAVTGLALIHQLK